MATASAKTQDFVDIKNVNDGVVVLKNGSLRKIVMVDGINFDLKSDEEQNVILYAYQSLLNSLDFSLQISIHSRKLNIDGYLEKLRGRLTNETNELLKIQLEEYVEFVESFVKTNAIMAKNFFVIIPYDPAIIPGTERELSPKLLGKSRAPVSSDTPKGEVSEAHINQLNQRVDEVISGLREIGLRAVSLEDPELLEVYFDYYNPSVIEKRGEYIGRDRTAGSTSVEDIIAPSAIEIGTNYIRVGDKLSKTLFVLNYPRYLSSGWFSPVINLPELMDISIFVHPKSTAVTLKNLRKKAAQIEAQIMENQEKGVVRNPALETAIHDIENLRDALQRSEEKLFDVGVYITLYAETQEELGKLTSRVNNMLDNKLVNLKEATFEHLKGFESTLPLVNDELLIHTAMNSGPVSSFFPFVSLELTSDEGVLHGINRHNNALIIFDRFSLENANMVIFGQAGAGKSYAAKLEVLRSLIMGSDVIVIDPEAEYETLANAVGGKVFKISIDSDSNINPLDLPLIAEGESVSEALKSHVVSLTGLVKLMLGKVGAEEEALLDQAITETYASRDITPDESFEGKEPPLLEDLEAVLRNIEGAEDMANRLYRFTKGSYTGFVNKPSNVDINNRLIVFSIRDLEEELRPIAMYIILNYIWGLIRVELKKRIMVVDEAWLMMKHDDSAAFLYGLAKRARKYYLGITSITQDVDDFIKSDYGKPIITNSSLQLLLKQSPANIETVGKAFNLTGVEKNYLLETGIGEGLFSAGLKHVAIQIVPSYFEDKLITTKPEEILEARNEPYAQ
jgi:conjugal transfer ATP-binding protein TraC